MVRTIALSLALMMTGTPGILVCEKQCADRSTSAHAAHAASLRCDRMPIERRLSADAATCEAPLVAAPFVVQTAPRKLAVPVVQTAIAELLGSTVAPVSGRCVFVKGPGPAPAALPSTNLRI